jgi:hypothetical protein
MADDAGKLPAEDATYYNAWINVAYEAIKALEQEYIGILIEAADCDFCQSQHKEKLLERVHN